ncbi:MULTISPECIES: GNAT family N-acetyltransferase [Microbacterium]|uniref:N-acetyltransferase n=1 Tax=Microbacterium wangchenii TaxID=2541726 RepID=A0ABX5SR60_9MICO|nr:MULTISPECIES: GNAT family N-acetyltransferase [Microbacterium]MCK6066397.1 N-acetyltransferase [Microbacterium sp. EYE_512]QBR87364.1 N-acetyltransferase [Microbacterium wangchenii]TFV84534.1 N-acetyltransferase [Microbacterium sp. dk485]TXK14686.1 N-acetyltransferase [Microbacterium wangchenii]
MTDDDITVTRNDDESRYEIHVGDTLGGFLVLEPSDEGAVELPHTQVDSAFKGRGLGTTLVGEALADLARRGDAVRPTCPFVVNYLRENEVAGLVVDWADDAPEDAASPSESSG